MLILSCSIKDSLLFNSLCDNSIFDDIYIIILLSSTCFSKRKNHCSYCLCMISKYSWVEKNVCAHVWHAVCRGVCAHMLGHSSRQVCTVHVLTHWVLSPVLPVWGLFVSVMGSFCAAQAGLKVAVLLHCLPRCWKLKLCISCATQNLSNYHECIIH